ncbi:MAG: sulfatase-like hydrolase/transferase [Rubripirellula sp.]|nr:sulfatase-like hydrolase/transferase [Rubripirellula sp.]
MVNVNDVSQLSPRLGGDIERLDHAYRFHGLPILVISLVIAAGLSLNKELAAADHPTNILLITCDNLGYGDLPCYNAKSTVVAPNLSRLASEGVRLTNFYTASPTCTVSRACLLTGRLPQRHGLQRQLPGVEGNYGVGLNQQERLLPQFLKSGTRPYATGCFGKWNIGFAAGSRPTERGFDEFVGHASGNMDYYHHHYRQQHDLYRGTVSRETEHLFREGEYSTDLFADAAIDFIRRHGGNDQPWFCYLPFNAPHFPSAGNKRPGQPTNWQAPDDAFEAIGLSPSEKDPRKRYEAVVFALDRAIGRVFESLEMSGQLNHTFVFFMSDNGAFRLNRKGIDVGRNDPLRSGGVTCWEGGLRVAAMARWPRHIPAGSVRDEPFWSPDLLVACLKIAGVDRSIDLPSDGSGLILDGKNPLPLLTQGSKSPHRSFFFAYRSHAAVRMGRWKIVRERPTEAWQLFNLRTDPGESTDLAGKEHDVLNQLVAEFDSWKEKLAME